MKVRTKLLLFVAVSAVVTGAQAFLCSGSTQLPRFAAAATLPSAAGGFAVVELFTSEGCSSCPPADRLLARLQQEDREDPVFFLVFHVDYWDRLGWKDVFSRNQYTRRQYRYAAWLNLKTVYTPEAIVNGQDECVGSDESGLRRAIGKGLGQPRGVPLQLSGVRSAQGEVDWNYAVGPSGKNQMLIVAVVQKSATTAVGAGENSGQTLSHAQIVRNLTGTAITRALTGSGSMQLPPGVATRDEELIAFVQDNGSGRITGATSATIP
ncbi:MAG TPA: DUF1223 domain-containing protein [Puia sp.]|nr:DUF1223 domain-containing protein [Puia sp.]